MYIIRFMIPKLITLLTILIPSIDTSNKFILFIIWFIKCVIDYDALSPGHSGNIYKLTKNVEFEIRELIVAFVQFIPSTLFLVTTIFMKAWIPFVPGAIAALIYLLSVITCIKEVVVKGKRERKDMGKDDLIVCFQDTYEKSNNGSLKHETMRAIQSNCVYKEGFVSKEKHRNENSLIDVVSGTTFDVAKNYCSLGKVAVLNFANPENPGGGVQFGAMAQEECLCRSSTLYACISNYNVFDEYYGYHRSIRNYFYTDRLIYTKNVTVFKDDSLVPQILPETDWFEVDVITCAAPYIAKRKHTNGVALFELFKSRVKNIFEAARDNKVDYLILGAFGCGAFKNPPIIVAEAFRRVIEEENYLKDFKQIVFAIKPTGVSCPNLKTFKVQFDRYSPDARERCFVLPESLEWRLRRYPALPTESRFSNNSKFGSWQMYNKYFGKQFSILGDSISTLDGFNPKGYKVFYADDNCARSGVVEAKDTWWDKVIGFFGGELLVNNSWSGSRVTKQKDSEQLFPSGCSDERTASLHINNVKPDVIIVYLGTNDWAFGAKTGNETKLLAEDAYEFFDMAYDGMLKKLKANYPKSEIWCCTLCETYISNRPDFNFPHKYAGIHIEKYNEIIRDIVSRNGCRLIDLYGYKLGYDSLDGTHPTAAGMNTIATLVVREMAGQEADQFLDCEKVKHEYVMSDPNMTTALYSNTLRLTIESSGKTVQIQKDVVEVGRGKDCDFLLDGKKYVARRQATFFYEKHMWFLRDNFTTNGTWLNGVKMEPGKKYQLISNDEINFAMSEKVVFYKSIHDTQSEGEADAKAISFLEAGMDTFAKSDHKDEVALKLIIAALSDAPLYFPVEIDLEAMLASADPTKLKVGDILQPSKDVKMRILTIEPESGVEFVPMFTSNDEVNKGPSASIIRYYPQDYLPMLVKMDKPVIINPFSESRFLLSKQIITEILWPAVQRKMADNKLKQENDFKEKSDNDNLVGSKIGERYTVLKMIGKGGFFKTYLVIDKMCNKSLAMKVCDKNQSRYSVMLREVILQEPYMMMKLNHPALPKVFDIVEDENRICIIMEYIEGQTLDTVLQENGPIKEDTVLTWAQQLCDVLGYLHKQNPPYVYRDMKPSNVILQPCGDIKLVDFGAVMIYDALRDQGDCMFGTKGYAAPEQYLGKSDPRSDIYSLGITLHHLLTGVDPNMPPHETKPIRAINPNLSSALEAIILKCTQLNPEDRFQNCDELLVALKHNYSGVTKPKGFFEKLFGGKSQKPKLNSKVEKIYEGMNKEYREKVFYGSVISANIILTKMTRDVFGKENDANIDLCFQIYLQTWIRSHGGLDPTFSTPSYIQQALCERFSSVNSSLVSKCVTYALCEIYNREPELKKRASAIEAIQNNVRANAQKNIAIENLYLEDSEYGLVPGKPIFVNGFGRDKEYLSHLYSVADEKLSFERVGSSEVPGIAGPVDLYRLILPNGEDYLRIFICNYGSSYKKSTPKGVKYID